MISIVRIPVLALALLAGGPVLLYGEAAPAAPSPAPAALPDAPLPRPEARLAEPLRAPGAPAPLPKYSRVIPPEVTAAGAVPRLSGGDKLLYAARGVARPVTVAPALWSAGYQQLRMSDPKYGSDAGAGAMKFGAAMLGSANRTLLSDGIFAALFHQDPRYYRVAHGGLVHRGLLSAEEALVRRGDSGKKQINLSGLTGRAVAAALTMAYYPAPSANGRVAAKSFGTSIATNALGNLVAEFFPNAAAYWPFLRKFEMK